MRRVTIKARLVNLRKAGARSTMTHLRYIERDGVGRSGEQGRAYGPDADDVDLKAFERRGRGDRHQFRFILSAEDSVQIEDLQRFTRGLMRRMEADLGTRLDWVAADHWDTDNPHTHLVLRGKDEQGGDLVIAGDYLAHGMRARAAELATEWLGPRTEVEIQQSQHREVEESRWTGLDRALKREMNQGLVRFDDVPRDESGRRQRALLVGRLQVLQKLGLADEHAPGTWSLRDDAEAVLRAMGERGDIIRAMQRAMGGVQREFVVFDAEAASTQVIGRVAGKGLMDELNDRGYLVIDGVDGRAHHVALGPAVELGEFPLGSIVEAKAGGAPRTVDRAIAARTIDGVFRVQNLQLFEGTGRGTQRQVSESACVRRLEALRRAGLAERLTEGAWRVPDDLVEKAAEYDRGRRGTTVVSLHSHLPVARQAGAVGATWLDKLLISGVGDDFRKTGFGAEVCDALRHRGEFLVEHGLAVRRSGRLVLARNLLANLRSRDIETAAHSISKEADLAYRPLTDGEPVAGIYRRTVQLVSGRFAMIESGDGFSLVPWKPAIDRRMGREVLATVRNGSVSLDFRQQRVPSRS